MWRTATVAVLVCALFGGHQTSSVTPNSTPASNTATPSPSVAAASNTAAPSVTQSTTNNNTNTPTAAPSVAQATTNNINTPTNTPTAAPSVAQSTTNNNTNTPTAAPSVTQSTTNNNINTSPAAPNVTQSTTNNMNTPPAPTSAAESTTNNIPPPPPPPTVSNSTTNNNTPTPDDTESSGTDSGSGSGSGTSSGQTIVVQRTGPSGTVSSPNYPNQYPNSQDYRYLITVTPPKVIRLTFTAFNVERGWDFVSVYDGNTTDNQLVRFTGDVPPPSVTSTGSAMLVQFTSDYSVTRAGFQASYTTVSKVYANCSVGQYRCGDGVTCVESWRRCNGEPDCSDASDEASCNCEGIPPDFPLCRVLPYYEAGFPNPFNHATIQAVRDADQIIHFGALSDSKCHPEVNELLCALLLPNCNQTTGRHQLPCRSWCEEVRASCKNHALISHFPSCEIFPNSSCFNIPPSEKDDDECYRGNGANYRGLQNTSPSGKVCERWDLDSHKSLLTTSAWANLEDNFCRNPDHWARPYCYVQGGFEECDIVPCDVVGCKDPGKPNFGQRSPLLKFYKGGDRITFTCDRGYKFRLDSPPNRAQCIANGTAAKWSSALPYCEVDNNWKLTKDIFSTDVYNKAFAPSKGKHLRVHAYIENVISLDEKNEQIITAVKMALEWEDERLQWEASEYGGLGFIYVRDDSVWKPGLSLKRNFNTEYKGGFPPTDVRVTNKGKMHATLEFLASTTCDLDPFLFPQDNMTCPVCLKGGPETIIACANNITDPDEKDFLTCGKTSARISTGEWNGRVILSAANNTACLTITIQRDPSYHYATTISPCIILVVLMIITFIMPIDKGDRIGFGVTVLLSMVVSLVVVTGFLPVKGTLPFIAMLIIVAMGMMGGFMLVTLCIIIIHDRKGTLPPWARKLFLRHLARMVFMGDLTKKLRKNDEQGDQQNDEVFCNWSVSNKVQPDGANGNEVATLPSVRAQQNDVRSNVPGLQGTLDELKTSVRQLSGSIEALAKANSGEDEEVTEYNLLAYVLDRICLFLYVAGIIVAIPCTLYLGR